MVWYSIVTSCKYHPVVAPSPLQWSVDRLALYIVTGTDPLEDESLLDLSTRQYRAMGHPGLQRSHTIFSLSQFLFSEAIGPNSFWPAAGISTCT